MLLTSLNKFTGMTARNTIKELLKMSKDEEAKKLSKDIGMSEMWFYAIEAKINSEFGRFAWFAKHLSDKKPKLPSHFWAQLLIEKRNFDMAKQFIWKTTDEAMREKLEDQLKNKMNGK